MKFLYETIRELRERLEEAPVEPDGIEGNEIEDICSFVESKLIESYRNGAMVGWREFTGKRQAGKTKPAGKRRPRALPRRAGRQ